MRLQFFLICLEWCIEWQCIGCDLELLVCILVWMLFEIVEVVCYVGCFGQEDYFDVLCEFVVDIEGDVGDGECVVCQILV